MAGSMQCVLTPGAVQRFATVAAGSVVAATTREGSHLPPLRPVHACCRCCYGPPAQMLQYN